VTLVDLSHLATALPVQDVDPAEVASALLAEVGAMTRSNPRSAQRRIGPSGLGHPCDRWVAYTVAGKEPVNQNPWAWKAAIGTAVHAALAEHFTTRSTGPGPARYLVEGTVEVGDSLGEGVTGSCDLYDRATGSVVDWKITTKNKIKELTRRDRQGLTGAGIVGPEYHAQAHAYGVGWTRRGLPVRHVHIIFIPRDGDITDAYTWHEPLNPQVVIDALNRVSGITLAVRTLGDAAFTALPTTEHFCTGCPYFIPGSTDPVRGCPGDPDKYTRPNGLDGLISQEKSS
jgi:hypothetical protein